METSVAVPPSSLSMATEMATERVRPQFNSLGFMKIRG